MELNILLTWLFEMIISAKIIKNPYTDRFCETSRCRGKLPINGEHVRLYGYANRGDKPYVIYQCLGCSLYNDDIRKKLGMK